MLSHIFTEYLNFQEEKEEKDKIHKIEKQKKKIGNVKFKKIYTDKGLQQV